MLLMILIIMTNNSSLKLVSQRRYRSELGVVSDILSAIADAGKEGEIISKISRKANLSYDEAIGKCRKLSKAGLVQEYTGKNRFFAITERGIKFFQEFQKFKELVQSINLLHVVRF